MQLKNQPPCTGCSSPNPSAQVTTQELITITCAVARLTSALCQVLGADAAAAATAGFDDEPYIWDLKED